MLMMCLSQIGFFCFDDAVVVHTHLNRLIDRINEASPFGDIRAMIWMSHQDYVISNPMSSALATKFKLPSIVVDDRGGFHVVPNESKVGIGMSLVGLDRVWFVWMVACCMECHVRMLSMVCVSFAVYCCNGLVVAFDTAMCVCVVL